MSAWFFYACVALSLCVVALLERRYSHLCYLLIVLLLFIVFSGSVQNGADWVAYVSTYQLLSQSDTATAFDLSPFEVGFTALMLTLSSMDADYQWLIVICGAVYAVGWFLFAKVHMPIASVSLSTAFMLFIEGWTLFNEQIRQGLAVIIVLFAYSFWVSRRRLLALILVGLACSSHVSSLFALLLFYLSDRLPTGSSLRRIFIHVLLVGGALISSFILLAALAQAGYLSIISAGLQERVLQYLGDEQYGSYVLTVGLALHLIGLIVVAGTWRQVSFLRSKVVFDAWVFSLCWCLLGPVLRFNGLSIRFEHYFLIFLPLICAVGVSQITYSYFNKGIFALRMLTATFAVLLAAGFMLRVLLNPVQAPWVSRYQNLYVNSLLRIPMEDSDLRRWRICQNLRDHDNDLCIYSPSL